MNADGRGTSDVEQALGQALGHIRNATETLLGEDGTTTAPLLVGLSCLDLQGMFAEIWPAWIPNRLTASESLAHAEDQLATILDDVPLAIWAALRALRQQVGDGHR